MRPDQQTRELTVTELHPGVTAEQVQRATGWAIRFSENLRVTTPPTPEELATLRALQQRTAVAHGRMGADA